jgi:hypothetical protein
MEIVLFIMLNFRQLMMLLNVTHASTVPNLMFMNAVFSYSKSGHIACMGEMRNPHVILTGQSERKVPTPTRDQIIKMNVEKLRARARVCVCVYQLDLSASV